VYRSYVAIGDSFTEGMGDPGPDGVERGWADLLALGIAEAQDGRLDYANLAIRGRKLGPLLAEQLEPAIAMRPGLLSVNGGGNDIMRPRMSVATVSGMLRAAVERATGEGIPVLLLSGADPSEHLPLGGLMRRRGAELMDAARAWAEDMPLVTLCDNFGDERLRAADCWSADGLHLGTRGHARVAANCLRALGLPSPGWLDELAESDAPVADYRSAAYYREFVLPWVGRRLTGRSSGDGRVAKRPELAPVSA